MMLFFLTRASDLFFKHVSASPVLVAESNRPGDPTGMNSSSKSRSTLPVVFRLSRASTWKFGTPLFGVTARVARQKHKTTSLQLFIATCTLSVPPRSRLHLISPRQDLSNLAPLVIDPIKKAGPQQRDSRTVPHRSYQDHNKAVPRRLTWSTASQILVREPTNKNGNVRVTVLDSTRNV